MPVAGVARSRSRRALHLQTALRRVGRAARLLVGLVNHSNLGKLLQLFRRGDSWCVGGVRRTFAAPGRQVKRPPSGGSRRPRCEREAISMADEQGAGTRDVQANQARTSSRENAPNRHRNRQARRRRRRTPQKGRSRASAASLHPHFLFHSATPRAPACGKSQHRALATPSRRGPPSSRRQSN